MSLMRCDVVRDRLPDLVNGLLSADETAGLRAHLGGCGACSAELQLIDTLRRQEIVLPFGLEHRVMNAVRAGQPRRAWPVARLAMAATVVFALVTAVLLRLDGPSRPEQVADSADQSAWELPGPEQTTLSRVPALNNLSDEQLERLLRELGS
jgi:anti-sigma factor RsiW